MFLVAIAMAVYYLEGSSQDDKGGGRNLPEVFAVAPRPGSDRVPLVNAYEGEPAGTAALRIGDPAPDFTLRHLDGKPTRLSDFRGRAVFLTFFGTWCQTCRTTMPETVATFDENKSKGAVVLAVALQDDLKAVRALAVATMLTFPVLLDPRGELADLYRIGDVLRQAHGHTGIPNFFIDRDGIIRDMYVGTKSKSSMQRSLERAMQW